MVSYEVEKFEFRTITKLTQKFKYLQAYSLPTIYLQKS